MLTITVNAEPDQLRWKLAAQTCTRLIELLRENLLMVSGRFAKFVRTSRAAKPGLGLTVLFLLLASASANAEELKPETLQA